MAIRPIRVFGDPVLKQRADEVTNWDDNLKLLAQDMLDTMYDAPGVGLAGPQVGVQKRIFVYDAGEGPQVVINPVLSKFEDEWDYDEGCLSVPGLYWEIQRPKRVHLEGYDLEKNKISIDADELLARVFQHETDHLDGILLIDRLDPKRRKQALKSLREQSLQENV